MEGPQLVEPCWRLELPSGRIVTCGIYRDPTTGFDLRAVFQDNTPLETQWMGTLDAARNLAIAWKMAVLESGATVMSLEANQEPA